MRRFALLAATALLLSACAQGLTEDEVQSRIDESIDDAFATTTVPETTSTSEPAATTTTTTSPTTTTTTEPPLPEFPPTRDSLDHGGDTWAVVLAASPGFFDPVLTTAQLAAEDAGYTTGPTDCDFGVAQALGLPEDEQYYSISVYFETEADANQARDAFHARGVGATVAQVQTFCLD